MIAFENAALGYPGKTVFANLNWTLPHRGTIALMGPSRMNYDKVIPTLEYFAAKLCQAMTGTGKEE